MKLTFCIMKLTFRIMKLSIACTYTLTQTHIGRLTPGKHGGVAVWWYMAVWWMWWLNQSGRWCRHVCFANDTIYCKLPLSIPRRPSSPSPACCQVPIPRLLLRSIGPSVHRSSGPAVWWSGNPAVRQSGRNGWKYSTGICYWASGETGLDTVLVWTDQNRANFQKYGH